MSLTFDEIEWNKVEDENVTVYVETSDYKDVIKSVINGIPDAFPILNKEVLPKGITDREAVELFGGEGMPQRNDFDRSNSLSEQRLLLASVVASDVGDNYSDIILVDANDKLYKKLNKTNKRIIYITERATEVKEETTLIWIKNNHIKMNVKVSELLSDKQIVECTIKEANYLKKELADYYVNSFEEIKRATVMLEGFKGKLPVNAETRTPTFAEYVSDWTVR